MALSCFRVCGRYGFLLGCRGFATAGSAAPNRREPTDDRPVFQYVPIMVGLNFTYIKFIYMKVFTEIIGNQYLSPEWKEKIKDFEIEYIDLD